jgi:hypothetical protein
MSNFKVLSIQDLPRIFEFEESKLQHLNEIDKMTFLWKAPWRKEALEFYLQTGWCMGAFDDNQKLHGYFLAQPLLFTETFTQTLWIEHMGYSQLEVLAELVDFAYKYSRDKHLQRVLFNKNPDFEKIDLHPTTKNFVEIYTTKMSQP